MVDAHPATQPYFSLVIIFHGVRGLVYSPVSFIFMIRNVNGTTCASGTPLSVYNKILLNYRAENGNVYRPFNCANCKIFLVMKTNSCDSGITYNQGPVTT